MKILKKIQEDLATQKLEMKNMEENIKQVITHKIDEKFNAMESKTIELEKKIELQEITIEQMNRQMRRKNLIIFGLNESEHSYEELQDMILEIINSSMKVPCNKSEIESVRRLGKKSDKIRPVILSVTTLGKKIEILKHKKYLKDSQIYINEDYTQKALQERQVLKKELDRQRELGNRAIIRSGKIITLPKKPNEDQMRQDGQIRNKRTLSQSPEIVNSSDTDSERQKEGKEKKIQPKKKNRPDIKSYLTPNSKQKTNED